ncbi:MAG: hypothetical protein V1754_04920, partial [Pseudomonadota bacterium]
MRNSFFPKMFVTVVFACTACGDPGEENNYFSENPTGGKADSWTESRGELQSIRNHSYRAPGILRAPSPGNGENSKIVAQDFSSGSYGYHEYDLRAKHGLARISITTHNTFVPSVMAFYWRPENNQWRLAPYSLGTRMKDGSIIRGHLVDKEKGEYEIIFSFHKDPNQTEDDPRVILFITTFEVWENWAKGMSINASTSARYELQLQNFDEGVETIAPASYFSGYSLEGKIHGDLGALYDGDINTSVQLEEMGYGYGSLFVLTPIDARENRRIISATMHYFPERVFDTEVSAPPKLIRWSFGLEKSRPGQYTSNFDMVAKTKEIEADKVRKNGDLYEAIWS